MAKHATKSAGAPSSGAGAAAQDPQVTAAEGLLKQIDDDVASGISVEPDWMVNVNNLTKSDVKGFEKYAHILAQQVQVSRQIENSAVGSANPGGGVATKPVIIVMPLSSFPTDITSNFSQNASLKTITMVRLASLNGKTEVAQQYIFTDCNIVDIKQTSDLSGFAFRYLKSEISQTKFDQTTGKKSGKTAATHDTNKVTTGK